MVQFPNSTVQALLSKGRQAWHRRQFARFMIMEYMRSVCVDDGGYDDEANSLGLWPRIFGTVMDER